MNIPTGNFDVLSGTPTASLALSVGLPSQNVVVQGAVGGRSLAGLGPLGYPNPGANGEGSFAVLFSADQSEFGFELIGGNGGNATIDFFRRDGSLIERLVVTGLTSSGYGFTREGSVADIAGISIFNDDDGGVGFANLRHDVPSGLSVPEPSTLALIGIAAAFLARRRLRS